ncbi:TetR/AcrR family transcriptional regulator [Campylobacter canadensis]|uniref:TetR/AcrR family transcriptional regulator n=1 Tax=Campylobacter canadensis TaxID=449520 RepID=UPI001CD03E20|nr:TetR/AcrR family transcriptional regulator [Campylobacter canadensis]MBZ7996952.1 TetR/AcrR family transcriptional regulator [Campylobacter canadensis]MBZ8000431.1 TetR/AcrR family transcriptional regulator [Campylobacter canadensis]MBZ8002230.1 TetR/AcrR family transcriptional regulator [Campylobacter canadensis]
MQDKKTQILKVAIEIFLAKGYENTNLLDITAKNGGSLATIYKIFSNKDELFCNVVEFCFEKKMQMLIKLSKDCTYNSLDEFLLVFSKEYYKVFYSDFNFKFFKLVSVAIYKNKDFQQKADEADKKILENTFANVLKKYLDIEENLCKKYAEMYISMLRGSNILDLFFATKLKLDEEQINKHISFVNSMFLKMIK